MHHTWTKNDVGNIRATFERLCTHSGDVKTLIEVCVDLSFGAGAVYPLQGKTGDLRNVIYFCPFRANWRGLFVLCAKKEKFPLPFVGFVV